MIERAAGCLEQGGRCLLRVPNKPFRSRRLLHSTFWSHGAGDIDLPSWWIALLQVRQTPCVSLSPGSLTDISQERGLMDFLYPAQTVAFFQQLISKDVTTLLDYRRRRNAYLRARTFSSAASNRLSSLSQQEPLLRTGPEEDDLREKLSGLLETDASVENNEDIWRTYQSLKEMSFSLSPVESTKLLRHLSTSTRMIDLERSLVLFDHIPTLERQAVHYDNAVVAALSQNELEIALKCHREALSRVQGSFGTSAVLRYAVQNRQFESAIEAWHGYCVHKQISQKQPDVWNGVDDIPLTELLRRAASAIHFTFKVVKPTSHQAGTKACDFSLQLISRSFARHGVMFDPARSTVLMKKATRLLYSFNALEEWGKTFYNSAITQLLSIDTPDHLDAAIILYKRMRKVLNTIPEPTVMEGLLNRCCAIQSTAEILMLLEDYRKYDNDIPKEAFKPTIRALAQSGDTQTLQSLFEEHRTRFGTPTEPSLVNSLLYVYFRRGEVEQIVQTFRSMLENYGFVPDLKSWNLVLSTFARVGDREGAMKWFTRLVESGLKPDHQTYATMMRMYAKRGDFEAVTDLLQQSKSNNVKSTMAIVETIVLAQVNDDQLDLALKTVEDNSGLKGSQTRVWNILLSAHAMRYDLEKVSEIYKRMQEAKVPADHMTYAALLQSLVNLRQPVAARKILMKIMPRSKIRVSSFHYAIVMGGFVAVKDYFSVFMLYNRMLSHNTQPSSAVRSTIIKAAAGIDMQQASADGIESEQINLNRAQEILDQTLATMDPMELAANEPTGFAGMGRLDEAFTSAYFSFLTFVYGQLKAFDKVSELHQKYSATHQKFHRNAEPSPPLEMLSALMVSNLADKNHDEVERCWYLALDKAEKLARRSTSSDLSDPGWVIPYRRFIIDIPLLHYMRSLEAQRRIDDIAATIDSLRHSGFELTSRSWNLYVQILVRDGRHALAYHTCEHQLIDGWPGWEKLGNTWGLKTRFRKLQPKRLAQKERMPNYPTLVYLASAYMDAQSESSNRMEELIRAAPRTVAAVQNMPKTEDEWQTWLLKRY